MIRRFVGMCCTTMCLALTPAMGLDLFMLGNSYTGQSGQDFAFGQWVIESCGKELNLMTNGQAGVTLSWFVGHGGDASAYVYDCYPQGCSSGEAVWTHALPNRAWDALSLQAFFEHSAEEYYSRAEVLMGEALKGNPDIQVYIYGVWEIGDNWGDAALWEQREADYETSADYLRARFPDAKPVLIIPANKVVKRLGEMADAGQLPGVSNHLDMYYAYPEDQHLSPVAIYAVICAWYACFFHESPECLPSEVVDYYSPHPNAHSIDPFNISAETIRVLKDVSWEIVSTYPYSGVTTSVEKSRTAPVINARSDGTGPRTLFDLTGKRIRSTGSAGLSKCVVVSREGKLLVGAGTVRSSLPNIQLR